MSRISWTQMDADGRREPLTTLLPVVDNSLNGVTRAFTIVLLQTRR